MVNFNWEVTFNETRKTSMTGTRGVPIAEGLVSSMGDMALQVGGGALYEEATAIMNASQDIVPVSSGYLKATGAVQAPTLNNGVVEVLLGYGGPAVDYAIVQHETPPSVYHHSEGQSWKYLERPAAEATRGMSARIAAHIRRRLAAEL